MQQSSSTKGKKKPTKRGKKGPSLLIHFALMALVVVAFGIAVFVGLNRYTLHGQEIAVPNLKGVNANRAKTMLAELGLHGQVDDSVYVNTIPAGSVFLQSIAAGDKVKRDRIIHLTVNSASAPRLVMPDVADNSSLREATVKLAAMGFKIGRIEHIKGEKDWVYEVKAGGHNVSVGSRVPAGESLTLVVGDGSFYEEDLDADAGMEMDSIDFAIYEMDLGDDDNAQ